MACEQLRGCSCGVTVWRVTVAEDGREAGGVEEQSGAVEGECRLGALVVVRRLVAEPSLQPPVAKSYSGRL